MTKLYKERIRKDFFCRSVEYRVTVKGQGPVRIIRPYRTHAYCYRCSVLCVFVTVKLSQNRKLY